MKGRGNKSIFSKGRYQWEVGRHKEKGNEGVEGGYIWYPYMSMED
jgi:hypothetical protein